MLAKNVIKEISPKVHQMAVIDTQDIPFRQYVVEACEMNTCGMYGKTWQCPPGVGDLEMLKGKCLSYEKAVVFTTYHEIEDSFDIEGMERGRMKHEKVTDEIAALFLSEKRVLSAEGCNLCEKCTYPDSPCRYPQKARSSVEANGISVVELAKKCGLHYNNGINTVTYFSVILY